MRAFLDYIKLAILVAGPFTVIAIVCALGVLLALIAELLK